MGKAPTCRECQETCEQTGRLTWYCPSCDVCEECGCPRADGFVHNEGCKIAAEEEEMRLDHLQDLHSDLDITE